MPSLYELENSYQDIKAMIQDDDEQLFNDTLESIDFHNDFNNKIENYGKLVLSVESDIDAIKAEEKRLADRRKAMERKIKRLELAMIDGMKLIGKDKVESPLLTVKVRDNQRVNVTDESLISDEYKKPQPAKVDKTAIKALLKEGVAVAGAEMATNTTINIK